MTGLIIIVAFTALLGLVLWLLDRRRADRGESAETVKEKVENAQPGEEIEEAADGECCGMHLVCEKSLLSPMSDKIEYYDDEELDRFRERTGPDDYSDGEIEEWRDILLTLRPAEIAGWARSVQLRRIPMPSAIRDELLMIVAEARKETLTAPL